MLAYNLRVGLAFRLIEDDKTPEEPEMDEDMARMKASRAGAEAIKARLNG